MIYVLDIDVMTVRISGVHIDNNQGDRLFDVNSKNSINNLSP